MPRLGLKSGHGSFNERYEKEAIGLARSRSHARISQSVARHLRGIQLIALLEANRSDSVRTKSRNFSAVA